MEGFAELFAGTLTLAHRIDDEAGKEFLGVADQAAAKVRGSLHRRTGRTAASVTTQERGGNALVGMGDGVPYAQYEEYGGRGWPHNPTGNFLYPAAMDSEPLLVVAGEKAARREIGAMNWPSP